MTVNETCIPMKEEKRSDIFTTRKEEEYLEETYQRDSTLEMIKEMSETKRHDYKKGKRKNSGKEPLACGMHTRTMALLQVKLLSKQLELQSCAERLS